MDTRDNMELTELREQVALLKEKLMRQQIISEQNIIAAAQKGISQLNKAGNIWVSLSLIWILPKISIAAS